MYLSITIKYMDVSIHEFVLLYQLDGYLSNTHMKGNMIISESKKCI